MKLVTPQKIKSKLDKENDARVEEISEVVNEFLLVTADFPLKLSFTTNPKKRSGVFANMNVVIKVAYAFRKAGWRVDFKEFKTTNVVDMIFSF